MAQRVYFNIEHTKYYGNHIFCSISAQFYKKQKNIPSVIIGEGTYAMTGNRNKMDDWILFYLSNMHLKLDVMMMTINNSRQRTELIRLCI